MSSESWRQRFLLVAHRGASAYEPENTLAAFRRAIDMGCDAIEFDVRFTNDGIPIVVHDEDLKRVAGMDRRVRELTLSEIRGVMVMGRERIPTLDEVLSEVGRRVVVFMEIKELHDEGYIVRMLKSYDVMDHSLVISFNYEYLKRIKDLDRSVEIGLLTYMRPLPIDKAVKLKAMAILPRYNLVTPNVIREAHSKRLKIYTWTINDVSIALKMKSYGVDGIATDDPAIRGRLEKQDIILKYGV
ncbi:MAG: glycerophosphodiester phosphodiesterase [Ignisphaera sp.]|nr:glycerophosphodiester phosphodiesterase [Ignisphaera sp.]MCX8167964.1 glycerophosphodiester phosphodiesterase [Ignisphaera sp.]MDW8085561.1 glycerophosphodiester phosphodiesterase [Ignisphaera sp.]